MSRKIAPISELVEFAQNLSRAAPPKSSVTIELEFHELKMLIDALIMSEFVDHKDAVELCNRLLSKFSIQDYLEQKAGR